MRTVSPWRVMSGSATPERVDPVPDDLDGLVEDLVVLHGPVGLEDHGHPALEVEAQDRGVPGERGSRPG